MKTLFRVAVLTLLFSAGLLSAKDQVESVFLFQNRKVTLNVPAGLGLSSSKDDNGMVTVLIADPKEKVSCQLMFLPDAEDFFASARNRKEFMNDKFQDRLKNSVEKAMQFEELDPKVGQGTYCVFTDHELVGKTKLPPGQFLISTAGIKSWPGVIAVFEIFSQDTKSKEYLAVLKMLRESLQEKQVPLQ
jgi:hypothetical protein